VVPGIAALHDLDLTGKTVVSRAVFPDFFTRIDGTDEFRHTVSGFDFHGRGPILLQDVGRKVFDSQTGEIIFRAGHTTSPRVRRPRWCSAPPSPNCPYVGRINALRGP
jgi:hypothetical protein